tara:strand:- start:342 stop:959 length:618 start_codon:yes stop_codon:yes gene_type:complete
MVDLVEPNYDVQIEGRIVILKPISGAEITEHYCSWLNNPEINEFLEVRGEQKLEDLQNYVNNLRSNKYCEIFAIFTKKNMDHIGNISVTHFNPNNQGYAVFGTLIGDVGVRRFGAGGEAIVMMVEYLFGFDEIRRIQMGAASDNIASKQVAKFLGFTIEGVLREHFILRSGKINDSYIYGLLRKEWEGHRKKLSNILCHMKVKKG